MKQLLKTYFGYDEFRPLQEEVIENVMEGKDSFVLMPTGGGKSLCYQLPALKFEGLTLVISPLIALMKDQVDALKANGIAAEYINSSLLPVEIQQIQEEVIAGKVKILYVAPERLALQNFQNFLKTANIKLIAVDEAHCISEWGHDFRPDYRNLKLFKSQFPNVPIIALTATATPRVREDIIKQLSLNNSKMFISSFDRENLMMIVTRKRKAFDKLLKLIQKHKNEPTIIYCFSRKDTENIAMDLQMEGLNALPYHAGLNNETRKKNQELFIKDEVSIIVATIAFGMGIDKPDIRLIVHYTFPKTIEGYYQEIGRAGRDGLPSECVLFYSYGDARKHEFFIDQMEDAVEQQRCRDKLNQVIEYCEAMVCRRKYVLKYFGEDYVFPDNKETDRDENKKGCIPSRQSLSAEDSDDSLGNSLESSAERLQRGGDGKDGKNAGCGACDVCLNPNSLFDATEITQKILSCVIRTGNRFGRNYIADVLLGKNSQQIFDNQHNNLSVFGIVQDFKKDEINHLMKALISLGFLKVEPGKYPTISVSQKGVQFLKQKELLELPKMREDLEEQGEGSSRRKIKYDLDLFEKLRILRKQIADENNVPPFMIFSDVSLQEMAHYFPIDKDNFSKIQGVGTKKLESFSKAFLNVIIKHIKENNLQPLEIPNRRDGDLSRLGNRNAINYRGGDAMNRVSTKYDRTKKMLSKKFPIAKIADEEGLKYGTIVVHIEKLISSGEDINIDYLKPPEERLERIKLAFEECGDERLRPVFEFLDEEYSYDEIRLGKMFWK
ncbi:RecQ family ATP-dependent DNA helicase [Candidatus Parcubacteria bacterium]|nr:RecQ family ATP-dependent DNA helicase [Candidatus Parcubacteria bacterium]